MRIVTLMLALVLSACSDTQLSSTSYYEEETGDPIPAPPHSAPTQAPGPILTSTPAPSSTPTSNPDLGMADQILELVNAYRAQAGVPALALSWQLNVAAQLHAEDIAERGYLSHYSVDGSTAGQRISRAGYDWRTWGENIASGYTTAAAVMQGWMNSSGHRANILSRNYTDLGVGYQKRNGNGTPYWVQNFGAR